MSFQSDHFTLERTIVASPASVWTAFFDAEARSIWSPPSPDEVFEVLEHDPRDGGTGLHRCGPISDPTFMVETRYHKVDDRRAVSFTELVRKGETPLAVAQIGVNFASSEAGTRLTLDVFTTSFVGDGMLAGTRGGWATSIENFAHYVEDRT
ncbi:MAG: SRPBCC domain-containing protein [Pseudomonadota bacterium]|nr:SRPBCC domain-containing protein [Pseudomonadota bacterium]